jgi:nitrogen regulatory protein PII-like uncharacterized protein
MNSETVPGIPGWPEDEEYGRRFRELDSRIERSFTLLEYRPDSEESAVLRYRIAKLAIASEDIRKAISVLEDGAEDEVLLTAMIELENACREVSHSYSEVHPLLVQFMNFVGA